ncbi:MAG TPA: SDR family NAD(P)-dependent oxidoreductase [Xanthobacteraceae bacterium]|nr:SDR family NAD(P)-dependent oxidoreductase [Xanthobacteraceae bacterium]
MDWEGLRVLVTGGASFIGSHLVDALVERRAKVTVVDDLSSGRLDHLHKHLATSEIHFIKADLRRQDAADAAVTGQQCVFHLAAAHGGRGYLETHETACASNFVLDGLVFDSCVRHAVDRIVYASSGCVYPCHLQAAPDRIVRLKEDQVGPPFDADGIYGWAKLMGEKVLAVYAREHRVKAVSCRYFTAYGPRATESHAVMAMIARAFVRQDPFEIWGTGQQLRNWTYVSDIVEGTLLAAEHCDAGEAINIGTMEGTRVMDAAELVLQYADFAAAIVARPEMPTGPYYRIADNTELAQRTGWRPKVFFAEGLRRTMDWYFSTKSEADVRSELEHLLFAR